MLEKNLLRDEAPLTEEEWKLLDETVVRVAGKQLVGRRFIDVFGPLGAGVQTVQQDIFAGVDVGDISILGEEDTHPVHAETRSFVPLPMIYKDFWVYWRDLETARNCRTGLDISAAAGAAVFVAQAEDNLILNGHEKLGFEGLLNAKWRNSVPLLNWDEPGAAFQNIVDAHKKLVDASYYGPFALVTSPDLYAKMQRVYDNTGVLEIVQVRELMTAGVFQTPVMPENSAVVVSAGPANLDIAIAQDLITGYLGPDKMNHPFRVFETLVLRIKRPESICTLEPAKKKS